MGEGVIANSAYGVAATFLPHKGGAVPESEKRRAAWCFTLPYVFVSLLSSGCSISSSLSNLDGAVGGAGAGCRVRCGVYVCAVSLPSCFY